MIILDRNARPKNTVFYKATELLRAITKHGAIDSLDLFKATKNEHQSLHIQYHTYLFALDFLYLNSLIYLDEFGLLHVHQNISDNSDG
ncbi:ABC-three component system middle component 6 [Corynebacterium pseudogenitalium]|uniref:ABC-three component system middle component 6 n=1 Tax=Corynebacterium pseudogenitalium TaxID=38303 RepID=UPI003AF17449